MLPHIAQAWSHGQFLSLQAFFWNLKHLPPLMHADLMSLALTSFAHTLTPLVAGFVFDLALAFTLFLPLVLPPPLPPPLGCPVLDAAAPVSSARANNCSEACCLLVSFVVTLFESSARAAAAPASNDVGVMKCLVKS